MQKLMAGRLHYVRRLNTRKRSSLLLPGVAVTAVLMVVLYITLPIGSNTWPWIANSVNEMLPPPALPTQLQCPQSSYPPYSSAQQRQQHVFQQQQSAAVSSAEQSSGIDGIDRIVLINLQRRADRRDYLMKMVDKLGLHVEVLNATDKNDIERSLITGIPLNTQGTSLDLSRMPLGASLGEVACWQSHVRANRIAMEHNERVLVLEDDVLLHDEIATALASALTRLDASRVPWDMLLLGHTWPLRERLFIEVGEGLYNVGYRFISPMAYVVNGRRAAEKYVGLLDVPFINPWVPWDLLVRACPNEIKRIVMHPYMVSHRATISDVDPLSIPAGVES